MSTALISKSDLLTHWLGHRNLTRLTIEKFPEDKLFTFQVEGMRTYADMIKELLSIAVPGLTDIVYNETTPFSHELSYSTKAELLQAWGEATPQIEVLYNATGVCLPSSFAYRTSLFLGKVLNQCAPFGKTAALISAVFPNSCPPSHPAALQSRP